MNLKRIQVSLKKKIQLFNIEAAKDSVELKINIEKAFETNEKVTKKFYDKFKKIHSNLQKAIKGIKKKEDIEWYASVLMNRLMFIYFLQKHFVIQKDPDFLLTKFDEVKLKGEDFYQDFLLPLFFYGFAKRENNPHKQAFTKKYGPIRYLNGGLFYPHIIEKNHYKPGKKFDALGEKYIHTSIYVDSEILFKVIKFLNGYTWYLDNRPLKEDTEINPDVLGYIFEKYINQKELGAYYTKEDITEYISKNTIIPFIFDKLRKRGIGAPDPTPFITNNIDIIEETEKYIESVNDFDTLKYIYKNVLSELSILDPAVGSGAFLFAALNILLPIYRKTLYKLRGYRDKINDPWLKYLFRVVESRNEEYFLTKHIILNNLYGSDIIEEAVEICKLRLFLQLAAHLPNIEEIEPLPDIDFNIYAGNSLVGGLSWEDLQNNYTMDIFTSSNREKIKENLQELTELKQEYKILNKQINQLGILKDEYKKVQQESENEERLKQIKDSIEYLEHQINSQIDIGIKNPFNWFIEFNEILKGGGFDVVIGNPPYVEYSKVKRDYKISGYISHQSNNLYAFFIERSYKLLNEEGRFGFIIPISFSCTKRMQFIQNFIENNSNSIHLSHFAERPSKLFNGAEVLLNIVISKKGESFELYSTGFNKWTSSERKELFPRLRYIKINKIREYVYPKFHQEIEGNIWNKIHLNKPIGKYYSVSLRNHKVYYRIGGGRYWKIFTNFQPKFILNGSKTHSSRENYLYFKTQVDSLIAISVFSSSLFYWYYINSTNCRDLNPFDLSSFPINLNEISPGVGNNLIIYANELMDEYRSKGELKSKHSKKTGNIQYQEFYPRLSKSILDKIDKELASHYGFNKHEEDYILNYDLKYRMGEY